VPRRVHVPNLQIGRIDLPPAQTHHLRDVLRLKAGDVVEAFDDAGQTAQATVSAAGPGAMALEVSHVTPVPRSAFSWTVGAAVPKGPRADWMVEKLAELGTSAFVPLITARSVSLPARTKLERWSRLAAEASRQSGRAGLMRLEPLAPLAQAMVELKKSAAAIWYFSTSGDPMPIGEMMAKPRPGSLAMLVGPEGGWAAEEETSMDAAGWTAVKLTGSVLRIETAAIAAAAIVGVWRSKLDAPDGHGDDPGRP
jgi:16S rRNA (uracil1498-N3)-methyltransferase